ncbi:SMP-30/gluconolactonase/LRE family protein [Pedobacter sp. HMF7647]|uniref:Regucalcin n=1 Tax=Hufsiella arboris TaxID=2695275 RepID=A0A7K1Y6F8_9SPHI|nr:SMP-30/gluconolactonase/LRE family protein [Hufsiella arboris]MXV50155.1 SMP-30/gluconolactonase/LRE family protein [Hufsiella arboris]
MQNETADVRLIVDAKAKLGEGSVWDNESNKLYWIDIEGRKFHIYDPATRQDKAFSVGERPGTVVPAGKGKALIALQSGIHSIDVKTGALAFITDPIKNPNIRFNDGKCDPSGRFWVGTMHLQYVKGAAVLFRFDPDHSVHTMLTDVTISNGIVWSPDKRTMYYVDTPTGKVDAFDFDNKTGEISNRRTVINVPSELGSPDGMTIDSEGKLWTALWGGSAVARWDPASGKLLQKIGVPAANVSSCAFGDKDFKTLYITTAQDDKHPLSGGLFAARLAIKGVRAEKYKGAVN